MDHAKHVRIEANTKSNNHGAKASNKITKISTIQTNDARSDWLNCAGGHTIGDLYFIFGSNEKQQRQQHVTVICARLMHIAYMTAKYIASVAYSCNHIFYFAVLCLNSPARSIMQCLSSDFTSLQLSSPTHDGKNIVFNNISISLCCVVPESYVWLHYFISFGQSVCFCFELGRWFLRRTTHLNKFPVEIDHNEIGYVCF